MKQDRQQFDEKPLCAVRGMIRPGAMCGKVLVGMKYCGNPSPCPHKVEQTGGKK